MGDADIYAPLAAEANERADKIVKQILDEYILETTAQGNASLLLDTFQYFDPSDAPAWPSTCVTHRVLASEQIEPQKTAFERSTKPRWFGHLSRERKAPRRKKKHRIKGAR